MSIIEYLVKNNMGKELVNITYEQSIRIVRSINIRFNTKYDSVNSDIKEEYLEAVIGNEL